MCPTTKDEEICQRSTRGQRMRLSPKRKRYLAVQRERGGRPSTATPERLEALAELLEDPFVLTKRQAAERFGISLQTLMRWQRQYAWLADAFEDARRARYRVRQRLSQLNAEERKRSVPPKPTPTWQMRLVCWHLVHRVPVFSVLTPRDEVVACERFGMPWAKWTNAKHRFPGLLETVAKKRARRAAFGREHGYTYEGVTPPDPNDRRTANTSYIALYFQQGHHLREL